MISQPALSSLSEIAGPEHIVTNRDRISEYASDATELHHMPDAVAFPRTEEEISRILKLANQEGFPVIPRGAGSGMSGGAVPVEGGLVMVLTRMTRILSVDQENMIAKVEPGVVTSRLQEAVEKIGLFYPPDPASVSMSTIGGNVAECAGGLRAVKYGVTRDYVLGLRAVLPTGEILKTGVETMKGVAGYDLTRLIIGSEGTLAVITGITLRLIPKPPFRRTMVAFFPNASGTVRVVSEIVRSGVVPTALEFMDRLCLECIRTETDIPIPDAAGAMLLIELDGEKAPVEQEADRVRAICRKGGALRFEAASGKGEAERLWEARRNASPSLYKLKPHKISEDVVVPRSRMAELVGYLEELTRRYGLPIPAFGHAGDGNIHVNIMLDKEYGHEKELAEMIVESLFRRVIEMGGTITGEHGIGITKAPYLPMEISGAALELMVRIKKAFDPAGILNPGKIFL